jgi:hypothetical protein
MKDYHARPNFSGLPFRENTALSKQPENKTHSHTVVSLPHRNQCHIKQMVRHSKTSTHPSHISIAISISPTSMRRRMVSQSTASTMPKTIRNSRHPIRLLYLRPPFPPLEMISRIICLASSHPSFGPTISIASSLAWSRGTCTFVPVLRRTLLMVLPPGPTTSL